MKHYLFLSIFLFSSACIENQQAEKTPTTFAEKLAVAAFNLTKDYVIYDPTYFNISYPNGDVPSGKGVCTDVVIRAYRKMGIDLQKEVHEDMKANFDLYPKKWGLKKTDTNIDHRRVPNLMVFFSRKGTKKRVTNEGKDYLPGDIVTWNLDGGATHIGVVSMKKTSDGKRYKITDKNYQIVCLVMRLRGIMLLENRNIFMLCDFCHKRT